jgi:2-hydroxychromene-2-carboxylate isomerase
VNEPAQRVVEFFFAPGSRYSYLAASQMATLAAETGCTIDWRPVHGPDLRRLRGADPFVGDPLSGQYDWTYRRRDAEAWAEYYGIPFREPPAHDFDFKGLVRAATAAKRLGAAASYGWRLCSAVYASDAWPLHEALCVKIAIDLGMAAREFAALLADGETERLMSEASREAYRRGAFGVPTFFVGDNLFWGNDRLVLLRHHLTKLAARA